MNTQKLRALRKEKNITQSQLAQELCVTQQAVAKWEKGSSEPDAQTLARLARYLEISADALLGIFEEKKQSIEGALARVAVIGTVKAGYSALAQEEDFGFEAADVKNPEGYRYLIVKGDSMEPFIREGDLALIRLQPTLADGEIGVVIYGDGEGTLKRFRKRDGNILLEPLNESYETLVLPQEEQENLFVFGRLVETKTKW